MKTKHILLTLSIVLISLLVVGTASASENVSATLEVPDFEEVVTVETDLTNTDNLSQDSENEPVVAVSENEQVISNAVEDNIIAVNSPTGNFDESPILGGNNTGKTGINISELINNIGDKLKINITGTNITEILNNIGNKTGLNNGTKTKTNSSFDISSIIDKIIKKDSIKSSDLTNYYSTTTKFKVTVMSGDKPLTSGNVVFTINNKQYVANIRSDGTAILSLKNLKPGTYYITSSYGQVVVQNKIEIKKSIITKDVSKKYKKSGKFTVKVLDYKGKVQAKQTVKIKLNGKTYTAKTNSKGIATFNIPKNLKVGKYTIKTTCKGLTISNKLTVKK